jgi:hypothetical protein
MLLRFCVVDCNSCSVVMRLCRASSCGRPGTTISASCEGCELGERVIGGSGACVAGGLALAISVGIEGPGFDCVAGVAGAVFLAVVWFRGLGGFVAGVVVGGGVVGAGVSVTGGVTGSGTGSGVGAIAVGAWACGGGTFGFFFLQPVSDNATRTSTRIILRNGIFL